ncbi:MAG: UDP-2,3-diacylglucosamine diphosphatase [Cellvibrionales bacterium]|jgi:UDP-2,3-diacylglucosamine hydrolase
MGNTLLISDLHLSEDTPEIEAGLNLLLDQFRDLDNLYILGDFFEYWIGDDDDTALHRRIISRLRSVSDAGTQVFVVRGNRDLALGEAFIAQIGGSLLGDTTVVNLGGVDTLLLHGDTLCTDDVEYQKMRQVLHDPAWQADMLSRPLEERREFARGLRAASKAKAENDPSNIIDVNSDAVAGAFLNHGVSRMIHGHTHRPDRHQTEAGERIVLGDWSATQGWYVEINETSCALQQFNY